MILMKGIQEFSPGGQSLVLLVQFDRRLHCRRRLRNLSSEVDPPSKSSETPSVGLSSLAIRAPSSIRNSPAAAAAIGVDGNEMLLIDRFGGGGIDFE
eukprot:CCRYP_008977-RA/>CCRYP_008977-RA protein AED:0.39 eAED:0.54 QI:498/0/0.5/1/0/0/2/0/96